ncbi:hypothetical protein [Hyphococcus sp.]|uniref:hypothetical protein n=1 Tax=Hyphococcus sp. TaxID=2038636 RepID=UPI003CCB838F
MSSGTHEEAIKTGFKKPCSVFSALHINKVMRKTLFYDQAFSRLTAISGVSGGGKVGSAGDQPSALFVSTIGERPGRARIKVSVRQ